MPIGLGIGASHYLPAGQVQLNSRRDLVRLNGKSAISIVRSAGKISVSRQVGNVVEIKASLRIPIIQVVRTKKTMSLRTHIPDLYFHVVREFALDGEIVLRGILAAHVWLKLAEEQNRTESRPIDRLAAWRVQDSIERIRVREGSALVLERPVEQSSHREGAAAERRFGTELLENKLLDRIVEKSPTCTNAGLARVSRTPSNSNARSECFVVGLCQAVGYASISRNDEPRWSCSCVGAIRIRDPK